jgi:curli biogenesis system outer membrane secretion channel CsgG
MKKQILAVAAALVFTALAPAQSHAQQVTQAKVPFAFQAGNTMMPAGEYQIQRALPSTKAVQQIRRTDSSASTFVLTNVVESRDKNTHSRLIFHCYSNECFLSEIWVGSGQGLKLEQSRREKEVSLAKTEHELAVVSLPLTVTP